MYNHSDIDQHGSYYLAQESLIKNIVPQVLNQQIEESGRSMRDELQKIEKGNRERIKSRQRDEGKVRKVKSFSAGNFLGVSIAGSYHKQDQEIEPKYGQKYRLGDGQIQSSLKENHDFKEDCISGRKGKDPIKKQANKIAKDNQLNIRSPERTVAGKSFASIINKQISFAEYAKMIYELTDAYPQWN